MGECFKGPLKMILYNNSCFSGKQRVLFVFILCPNLTFCVKVYPPYLDEHRVSSEQKSGLTAESYWALGLGGHTIFTCIISVSPHLPPRRQLSSSYLEMKDQRAQIPVQGHPNGKAQCQYLDPDPSDPKICIQNCYSCLPILFLVEQSPGNLSFQSLSGSFLC